MDRRERFESLQELLIAALDGRQRELWTAFPCVIQSFDPVAITCTAQPQIPVPLIDPKTELTSWVNLPLLVDVPVHFPNGGGYTLTFPVAKGDEALVVFASRCIDSWWYYGSPVNPTELRMHDLSDGFAFVGIRSQARKLANISTNSTQLRSEAGNTLIDLKEVGATGTVTVTSTNVVLNTTNTTVNDSGVFTVNGVTNLNGNVTSTGTFMNNGHSIGSTHVHSGVQSGGSNSGPPV